MIKKYENWLVKDNLAPNTVESYVWTLSDFFQRYGSQITKKLLLEARQKLCAECLKDLTYSKSCVVEKKFRPSRCPLNRNPSGR